LSGHAHIQERDHTDNRKVDNLENVEAAFMVGGFLGVEVKRLTMSIEGGVPDTSG
jgi:hypothetical protein